MRKQGSHAKLAGQSAERPIAGGGLPGLAVAVGVLGIGWLVVLPWLAKHPAIDARLQWLEARGIDASATYYTELPAMPSILDRISQRRREQVRSDQ